MWHNPALLGGVQAPYQTSTTGKRVWKALLIARISGLSGESVVLKTPGHAVAS